MKNKTTLELVHRLNNIMKEFNNLDLEQLRSNAYREKLNEEWDAIVYELWDRIPSLSTDGDLQPKRKKKVR